MPEIAKGFEELATAFRRQFNSELSYEREGDAREILVGDDSENAVRRLGSVRANWLKRNAPKYGFVRKGETPVYSWSVVSEAIPAVLAEEAEVAAVVTAVESLPEDEPEPSFPVFLDRERDEEGS